MLYSSAKVHPSKGALNEIASRHAAWEIKLERYQPS
jgi:hypothetical protein